MDKMEMKTPNMADENFKKLIEIFPNIVTETIDENGNVIRAINKEMLEQEISTKVVDGPKERYQFTWPEKKQSILAANAPTTNTLRPSVEDSVNFDTTKNLYIEGDNLEVLKILQETYLGKVKMIYIDPPYNTGSDFVYEDDFAEDMDEYMGRSGDFDEEGNRLFVNTERNGRFHTDWLNMMYSRLKMARNLLSDDGVIFISIDDNEQANLKKICDEVFGEGNFIANISIITGANQSGEGVLIQKNVEYCLVYGKNKFKTKLYRVDKTNSIYRNLNDAPTPLKTRLDMGYTIYFNEITGDIIPKFDYDKEKIDANEEELVYTNNQELINLGYVPLRPGKRNGLLHRWRWGYSTFIERVNDIKIFKNDSGYDVKFLQSGFNAPKNYWNFTGGTLKLKSLFDKKNIFDYSKGELFLKYIASISTNNSDVVLDFFSGSATTAHAVMQLNAEDGGNRQFIMVQLKEETDEKSEAYKAGYKNICEIGKERIRRAGEKIKEDFKDQEGIEDLDVGFRVLKVDSSNMEDVYYNPMELQRNMLLEMSDNIKSDRTDLDLLFQVMLDLGIEVSSEIREFTIEGKKCFSVEGDFLIACFDKGIDTDLVKEIANRKPIYAVILDRNMESDSLLTNFEQIFKEISPDTVRKVL